MKLNNAINVSLNRTRHDYVICLLTKKGVETDGIWWCRYDDGVNINRIQLISLSSFLRWSFHQSSE